MTDRELLIHLAEMAHRKEQEREAKFGTFLAAHLGLPAAAANEKAKALLQFEQLNLLPDEQLNLLLQFALDLPAGYYFSDEQFDLAMSQQRGEA